MLPYWSNGGIGRHTQYQSEFSENLYASNVRRIKKADISSGFESRLLHKPSNNRQKRNNSKSDKEKYAGQYRYIDCDSGKTHEGLDAQCLFD